MDDQLLEGLNPSQLEAVRFMEGPLLILAGPGSGKTRVVTHRIAHLLAHGVCGYQIAALTFTNKAADEMRSRVEALAPNSRVWVGTFHRFCSWILRNHIEFSGLSPQFTIYDTDESRQLLETLVDKRDFPSGVDSGKILAAISWAKNGLVLPDDYRAREGDMVGSWVEKVYPEYQMALRRANAVDFDDLLLHVALMLRQEPEVRRRLDERFRYILVDEYQDTNLVQYAIARALSIDYPNLAVTGDPDQSIYGWRGANIKNILDFEKDFENVTVIRLEENYRSTKNILAVASHLIRHNRLRKEKELYTSNPEGAKPRVLRCFNHQEEAESIAREIAVEVASGKRSPRDYAIFFRMNALSRNLEHALRRQAVPFQLVRGLEFFNRKEIKDLIAYLQLIWNPNDFVSFLRVVNLPTRGIGRVTINRLRDFAERSGFSLMEAARRVGQIREISLKTSRTVAGFAAMIDRLGERSLTADLETLISLLLKETRYTADLEISESEEDKQRLANVQELLSEAREFDRMFDEEQDQSDPEENGALPLTEQGRLGRFLELSALTSDVDALEDADRVSLMTLHAAKGLEFPVVYIIALEDNILPHERSIAHRAQLEEERRLLFVGITRAKEELRLSRTEFREYRGTYCSSILSRFLFELPKENIDWADTRDGRFSAPAPPSDEENDKAVYLSDFLAADGESDGEDGEIRVVYEDQPKKKRSARTAAASEPNVSNDSDLHVETDEYCDVSPSDEAEITFDEEGRAISSDRHRRSSRLDADSVRLAADISRLKKERTAEPADWKLSIRPGALIRHVDYGIGVIKYLDGPASDRVATIEFLSGVGIMEVAMADSGLRYVAGR